ncbi:MAG: hypothetical protein CSA11_04595 [Chloroflexi bacterium]|nr:MAG: hypothetical protein CSA11_04595 [Chloroflexota bacterium]
MMKQPKIFLLIGLFFLTLCFAGYFVTKVFGIKFDIYMKDQTTPISPTYAVQKKSSNFEMLWTIRPEAIIGLPENEGSILMSSKLNKAYVLSKTGSVTTLNLIDGMEEQLIRVPYKAMPVPIASTMGINSRMLYIGFESTQKVQGNMTWGTGKVEAYDITSGMLKWSQEIPGASSINSLIVTEDTVSVDGSSSSNYYLLDAESGEIVESDPKLNTSFVWRIDNNLMYERPHNGPAFQLFNQEQNKIIWQSENFSVIQPPIFTDQRIVAKSGSQAIALNIDNGQPVWQYSKNQNGWSLFSNIAESNNIVYFITSERNLLAIDILTGAILGQVQFLPLPNNTRDNDTFHVTASGEHVLVHTGSGNQIFSFRFSP